MLFVGDSIAHNTNFRKLEIVTKSTIKTAKAYSSVFDNSARFKEMNVTDVVKNELNRAPFDHLVLAAPTVDITNLDTARINPTDNTGWFKEKIEKSCQNMIRVAEEALTNNSSLKKVTLLNHAPRFDTPNVDPAGLKPNLANFANSYLLELWLDSPLKKQLFIGSHTLDCSADGKMKMYKHDHDGRYDGVHLYGSEGKTLYTASVINILLSSFTDQKYDPAHDDSHSWCPQTKYARSQKKSYSSAVSGKETVKTQNRFSPLGNC